MVLSDGRFLAPARVPELRLVSRLSIATLRAAFPGGNGMHCFSTIRAWSVALAVTLIAGVSLALPRAAEAQVIMMPD